MNVIYMIKISILLNISMLRAIERNLLRVLYLDTFEYTQHMIDSRRSLSKLYIYLLNAIWTDAVKVSQCGTDLICVLWAPACKLVSRNNCVLGGWRMETGDSRRGIAEVCTTMESVFTGEDEASWDEKRDGLLCCAGQRATRRAQREERDGAIDAGWTGVVGGEGRNGTGW